MYRQVNKRECSILNKINQEDPFYNPVNQAHLKKSVQELKDGKGKIHELIEDDNE